MYDVNGGMLNLALSIYLSYQCWTVLHICCGAPTHLYSLHGRDAIECCNIASKTS